MTNEERKQLKFEVVITSVVATWCTIWVFVLFIKYGIPLLIPISKAVTIQ